MVKSCVVRGRIAVAVFAAIGFIVWTADAGATTAPGRTVGSFAISPNGAATYTIPIFAPRGPNGLQPSIALVYSSQTQGVTGTSSPARFGRCGAPAQLGKFSMMCLLEPALQASQQYLGVGWSVQGLSEIYRCNLTYAQDEAPAAVSLSISDGYCLDGQRLRLTGGTYGTAGSTYQTEIANFKNVTAYGTAGNGPSYFVVQTPDGRTWQYGDGGNSQVLASGTSTALAWMLDKVSDPYGNTMTVSYETADGSAVPSTISWTPTSHGASTYAYTMTFSYGTNALPSVGYVAGTQVENSNLLESITIDYSGSQVKEYVLTYQDSATTGRPLLTQVQECAASTSNCLSPTTISYQSGSAGISSSATTPITSALGIGTFSAHRDFNGDGYTDLIYAVSGTWYVRFGSSGGYGSAVSTGVSGTLGTNVLFGDLLGNGQDGILANHSGTWYYYTWNGSSFVGQSTGLAFDTTAVGFAVADIYGDGLPALAAVYLSPSDVITVKTRANTSSGTTASFSSSVVTALTDSSESYAAASIWTADGQAGSLRAFDFNGDGREDLVLSKTYCGGYEFGSCIADITDFDELIAGNGGTFTEGGATGACVNGGCGIPTYLNWNDDACTDFALGTTVYISPCNGGSATTLTASYGIVGTLDWNGDGRADLLETNGSSLVIQLSTGSGLGSATTVSAPSYSSSCTYVTFDANGDGLDDLACVSSSGFSYYTHSGVGQPPDLLSQSVDGYGNSVSPTYVSLVRSNYTNYTDAVYPDENYIGPLYVVSQATLSDPSSASSATYYQSYQYYGAWTNLQGRGFEGFYARQTYDSRDSQYDAYGTVYDNVYWMRKFPYTGIAYQNILYDSDQYIRESTATYSDTELETTSYQERYFPWPQEVTKYRWEVNGAENGDLVTTATTNYTFDNYGNPTSITKAVTDEDSGSPYYETTWTTTTTNTFDVDGSDQSTDLEYWCLNLLDETVVANTDGTPADSVTRTKDFTPTASSCNYSQTVTAPSTAYQVTESFGYDSFGNVDSDTVTGVSMTARTTTASWTNSTSTTGQFPMSVTDPTGATTTLNYNFSFGVPSSKTDPNGLTTSWQYTDGFGRKTQETRPDGTYTTWTYYNCASYIGCPLGSGANGMNVLHDVYETNGTALSYGVDFLDAVGRELVNIQIMMNGSTYARNEQRYDSLGRVSETAFPCTYAAITTPCSYWTTNTYDVLNRLTESQRPISSTNSNLQTTTYAYSGPTTTVTDPYNNIRTTVKDVNGWLRRTEDPMGYMVTLGYDAAGSKTSVTDNQSNTLWTGTYAYGLSAFLTSASDMDMGAWSYTVDALGERTGWTDAKAQSFSMTYDALSRPLTRTEPDLFTQWTWGSSASSHNIGKLQSVCTGTGTNPTNCTSAPGYAESETYDSDARLSTRAITMPVSGTATTFTYTYAYNSTTGLLNTLTYPTSTSGYAFELQYGYSAGILSSVTDTSDMPNVTVWTANSQNPDGQITEETLGNGIVTNRAYDALTYWLSSIQSGVGGGSGVKNLAFLYDEMGDVTQRQDNNLGLTENLYYDDDYRLSYTELGSTQNLSINYDVTGNITSRSDIASGATWTYSSTHKHQVTEAGSSSYTYAYDANGNMTNRQGQTMTWSSYNYPTAISAGSGSTAETVDLYYGPNRQRWYQYYSGNSTTEGTYYIGKLLEMVVSGSVTTYRHYINAGNEPIAVYSRNSSGTNAFNYFLSDHQSSMSAITNSSGGVVVNESFTPYGSRRNPTTWSGSDSNSDLTTSAAITRQAYTFQTQLGLWMGLNHMKGRVEDSLIGRFMSADPTIPDPTNPQDYNRYSYVTNNPLTMTDPSGFASCPPMAPCQPGYYIPTLQNPGDNGSDHDPSFGDVDSDDQPDPTNVGYFFVDLQPVQVTATYISPDDQSDPDSSGSALSCQSCLATGAQVFQSMTSDLDISSSAEDVAGSVTDITAIPASISVIGSTSAAALGYPYAFAWSYQINNQLGLPVTGPGYSAAEFICCGVQNTNGEFVSAPNGMIAQDLVGLSEIDPEDYGTTQVQEQMFVVEYNGTYYSIPTILQHTIAVSSSGALSTTVTVVSPYSQ